MNICSDLFSLEEITEEQLNIILINLRTDKATGLDNLPARFIKDGASEILTILTYLGEFVNYLWSSTKSFEISQGGSYTQK